MISARVDTCRIHFLVGDVLGHHCPASGRPIIEYDAVRYRIWVERSRSPAAMGTRLHWNEAERRMPQFNGKPAGSARSRACRFPLPTAASAVTGRFKKSAPIANESSYSIFLGQSGMPLLQ
jgi:hypothetical protein